MSSPSAKLYDCIIIGGGPAGLAVASTLARLNCSALVFDSGVYRNAPAKYIHNVLGWDHRYSTELYATVREGFETRYSSVQLQTLSITAALRVPSGYFEVVDSHENAHTGKTLVLATGIRDVMPDIEGYAQCWGRGIFHCLICHGYEERGAASVGVLAIGTTSDPAIAVQTTLLASRFASTITIYTHGDETLAATLKGAVNKDTDRLVYEHRKITNIRLANSESSTVIITLEGDIERQEEFLAHSPDFEINGPFVEQLALETTASGEIKTSEPFGETTQPGVFAAGDIMTSTRFITSAALSGGTTGAGIAGMLAAASL